MADTEITTFDDATSTASHGWMARNMVDGSDYGWSDSTFAGGVSGAGEMGGTVSRGSSSSYADEWIGTVTAERALYASGRISFNDINFNGTFYFGWYNEESGVGSSARLLGFRCDELSGGVRLWARRQLPGGGSSGNQLDVADGVYDFSISYVPNTAPDDPNGLITVTVGDQVSSRFVPVEDKTTEFNKFGLFTRDRSVSDEDIEIYIDDLLYTSSDPNFGATAAPIFQEADNELDETVDPFVAYTVKPTLNEDVDPRPGDLEFSFSFVQPADPAAIGLSVGLDGVVTWDNPTVDNSPVSIELQVDNGIGQDTLSWIVTVDDPVAPDIEAIPDQEAVRGGLFTLQPVLLAAKPSPAFSLDAASEALGLTIDPDTGVISWTVFTAEGSYPVEVTATNAKGSDTESFSVIVVDIPGPKECEMFDDPNVAEANGWMGNMNRDFLGNDYGWSNTNNAGGVSVGELGGIVSRADEITSYMDETIGLVSAEYPMMAIGKISINDINFDGSFYFGWRNDTGDRIGFVCNERADGVRLQAEGFGAGNTLFIDDGVYDFSIFYDPDGGDGDDGLVTVLINGEVTTVTVAAANKATVFDKFGLSTRPLSASDRNIEIYIDDLCYTSTPVNLMHVNEFSEFWGTNGVGSWVDLYKDGVVDVLDLEPLAALWLTRTAPEVTIPPLDIDLDPNLTVTGTGFVEGILADGERAYANRSYNWINVPDELSGAKFTFRDGGQGVATMNVLANEDAYVYIAVPEPQLGGVDLTGWTLVIGADFQYTAGGGTVMNVFKKELLNGQDIDIPQGAWGGPLVIVGPNSTIVPTP